MVITDESKSQGSGVHMAGNPKNIHVVKTPTGWIGKREGAQRPSVTGNTQAEVITQVTQIARREQGEVLIHRGDNAQIRERNTYGSVPDSF